MNGETFLRNDSNNYYPCKMRYIFYVINARTDQLEQIQLQCHYCPDSRSSGNCLKAVIPTGEDNYAIEDNWYSGEFCPFEN